MFPDDLPVWALSGVYCMVQIWTALRFCSSLFACWIQGGKTDRRGNEQLVAILLDQFKFYLINSNLSETEKFPLLNKSWSLPLPGHRHQEHMWKKMWWIASELLSVTVSSVGSFALSRRLLCVFTQVCFLVCLFVNGITEKLRWSDVYETLWRGTRKSLLKFDSDPDPLRRI